MGGLCSPNFKLSEVFQQNIFKGQGEEGGLFSVADVFRGSAGEYQAGERAGVARLSWRVSGR